MSSDSAKEIELEVRNLCKYFPVKHKGVLKAVDHVSFQIQRGETLGIVGESGCGKTTCGKTCIGMYEPQSGEVLYQGKNIHKMSKKERFELTSKVQMIFQDPMTSLNPTMTIGKQIMESLIIHRDMNKAEARKEAIRMLEMVKIPSPESRIDNYPHELSGGMRQRVMIAIALACNPKILIADEPTTALDVTIQAQIMDLMRELKEKSNTAIILVTHDLGVVANFADRIQVMYAGQVVERGTAREIFYESKHPYTWALLQSVPRIDSEDKSILNTIEGNIPDMIKPPKGCGFCPRCPYAMEICAEEKPETVQLTENHSVSCWLMDERADRCDVPFGRKNV